MTSLKEQNLVMASLHFQIQSNFYLFSLFIYLFFRFARQPTLPNPTNKRENKNKKITKEKDGVKGKDKNERRFLNLTN